MKNLMSADRRIFLIFVAPVVAVLLVTAVFPIAPANAQTAADADMAAVINGIWSEYEEANMAGDSERWIALWDENGVKMSPGSMPVLGKEAIYAGKVASNEKNAAFDVDMKIMNEEFEVAGDWAWCRGTYTYEKTPKAGGDTAFSEGKFLTILQKQPDGTWKLYRDITNANPL